MLEELIAKTLPYAPRIARRTRRAPLHRRRDRRGRARLRAHARRRGHLGDGRRARRGHRGRVGDRDHGLGLPRADRRARRRTEHRERLDQADLARSRPVRGPLSGAPRGRARPRGPALDVRADRHGELAQHRCDARDLAGAAPRGTRGRRRRAAGDAAPDGRRRTGARAGWRARAGLQGHLPRAGVDRLPGRRGGAGELPRDGAGPARRRLEGRARDPRRAPHRGRLEDRRRRGRERARRAADAARRARGPAQRAACRRAARCACTCPTARAGTSTRCGACRRTRRSRGTSRGRRSASSGARYRQAGGRRGAPTARARARR